LAVLKKTGLSQPHHLLFPLLVFFNFEGGGGSLKHPSPGALPLELKSSKLALATLKLFGQ
jgi:hypothetical protein